LPRQGKTKGSTFQTFFYISDAVPHFINGSFEIPEQLAVGNLELLKVKGYVAAQIKP